MIAKDAVKGTGAERIRGDSSGVEPVNANVQLLRRLPEIKYARLADWYVDFTANRVQRAGVEVRVTPKAMAVLRQLMAQAGQVVRRDDLLGTVWRDGFPTDDVLTHAITELRRALEADPRAPKWIETIPRVGYRLLAPIEIHTEPPKLAAVMPVVEVFAGPSEVVVTRPPTAAEPGAVEPAAATPPPAAPSSRTALHAALALAVVAVIVAIAARAPLGPDAAPRASSASATQAPAPPVPLASNLRALTTDLAREQFPSLSPDGGSIAYVGATGADDSSAMTSRIFVRSLDVAGEARALTTSTDETSDGYPVWSPDGTRLAFLHWSRDACEIRVMPALGGPSQRVGECRTRTLDYIDWAPDGQGLLLSRWRDPYAPTMTAAIVRLDLASGTFEPIPYRQSPTESDLQPRPSPDGRWLAFRRGAAPYSDLWVVPYAGGEPRRVTRLQSRMRGYAWYPDGRTILLSSDHEGRQALYRVDVASGAIVATGITSAHFPSIARRQPVAVFQQEMQLNSLAELEWKANDPKAHRILAAATRSDGAPRYSPDGSRLAFVSARSGDQQLWVYDYGSDNVHPVTRYHGAEVATPRWSPDGTRVMHVVRGNGRSRLAVVEVESGRLSYLGREDENIRFGSYSHDGRHVDYASDRGGRWQAWRMPVAGGEPERLSEVEAIDPHDPLGDGYVYYARENDRGLYRTSLATRQEELVAPFVGYWNLHAYQVRRDGLYFADAPGESTTPSIYRVPLAQHPVSEWQGDEPERVRALSSLSSTMDLTIAPDLSRVVAVMTARDDTDLMAVTLAP